MIILLARAPQNGALTSSISGTWEFLEMLISGADLLNQKFWGGT